nr:MAG TPA: hypothetical protein [Caudoviricetes sp.]
MRFRKYLLRHIYTTFSTLLWLVAHTFCPSYKTALLLMQYCLPAIL